MAVEQLATTPPPSLTGSAIQGFKGSLRGPVLCPGEAGYEAARQVWNGMIDRRPALIVRCAGVADVINAVNFARTHDLLVAVRGGGHNVAGTAVCNGGMVIDLSPMKGMRVDPVTRTASAAAGLLWGEFDHETQAFGLATPGGIVTHTGIAGLTLGGGIGWLMRQHGLTCDNLLAADVVTADGQFLHASAHAHADLFWGLRGGGGNFGIVTSFTFRLHPIGPLVLAGVLLYAAEHAPEVLRFYRDYIATAPNELTTIVNLRQAPPAPFLPAHIHGRAVVIIAVCYAGGVAEGEQVLKPLRAFGAPLVDLIRPTPYTAHQGMFDASVPHGLRYYWKSEYLQALSNEAIDTLVAHAWQAPSPTSYTIMFQLGGAIQHLGAAATAFEDRHAQHALNINGVWSEPQATEAHIQWTRAFWEAMRPFSTGRVYVNFLGDEGADRVKAAYGAEKYARLVALKNTYDPTNMFRLNQNIGPTV
ncbi:MAG TPA: FAD-binding oxidoreductase [Candidatus Tectomicrobia bacterium]|jgi:FAD/FMN-containing dehydrogenase